MRVVGPSALGLPCWWGSRTSILSPARVTKLTNDEPSTSTRVAVTGTKRDRRRASCSCRDHVSATAPIPSTVTSAPASNADQARRRDHGLLAAFGAAAGV